MNWRPDLDMTIILVSADIATIYIGALFFSERARRWVYQTRWGSVPFPMLQLDSARGGVAEARAATVLSGELTRLRQTSLLPNPFDPTSRASLASGTMHAHEDNRRPTFRRSIALLKRVAQHESAVSGATATPRRWLAEAQPALPPTTAGLLNPQFEAVFRGGSTQEPQHV